LTVDKKGLSTFLVCKIGVAFAVISLMGAALVTSLSAKRTAEQEDLEIVADAVLGSIQIADSVPGEVALERKLPTIGQQFEVKIIGERQGNWQAVRVLITAQTRVERTILLTNEVNGGEFEQSRINPMLLRLRKLNGILLELV